IKSSISDVRNIIWIKQNAFTLKQNILVNFIISFFYGIVGSVYFLSNFIPLSLYILRDFFLDGYNKTTPVLMGFYIGSFISITSFHLVIMFKSPSIYIFLNCWDFLNMWFLPMFYLYLGLKVKTDEAFFWVPENKTFTGKAVKGAYVMHTYDDNFLDEVSENYSEKTAISEILYHLRNKKTYISREFIIGIFLAIFQQPSIFPVLRSISPATSLESYITNSCGTYFGLILTFSLTYAAFFYYIYYIRRSFLMYIQRLLNGRMVMGHLTTVLKNELENKYRILEKEPEKNKEIIENMTNSFFIKMKKLSKKYEGKTIFGVPKYYIHRQYSPILRNIATISLFTYSFFFLLSSPIEHFIFHPLGLVPRDNALYSTAFDPYIPSFVTPIYHNIYQFLIEGLGLKTNFPGHGRYIHAPSLTLTNAYNQEMFDYRPGVLMNAQDYHYTFVEMMQNVLLDEEEEGALFKKLRYFSSDLVLNTLAGDLETKMSNYFWTLYKETPKITKIATLLQDSDFILKKIGHHMSQINPFKRLRIQLIQSLFRNIAKTENKPLWGLPFNKKIENLLLSFAIKNDNYNVGFYPLAAEELLYKGTLTKWVNWELIPFYNVSKNPFDVLRYTTLSLSTLYDITDSFEDVEIRTFGMEEDDYPYISDELKAIRDEQQTNYFKSVGFYFLSKILTINDLKYFYNNCINPKIKRKFIEFKLVKNARVGRNFYRSRLSELSKEYEKKMVTEKVNYRIDTTELFDEYGKEIKKKPSVAITTEKFDANIKEFKKEDNTQALRAFKPSLKRKPLVSLQTKKLNTSKKEFTNTINQEKLESDLILKTDREIAELEERIKNKHVDPNRALMQSLNAALKEGIREQDEVEADRRLNFKKRGFEFIGANYRERFLHKLRSIFMFIDPVYFDKLSSQRENTVTKLKELTKTNYYPYRKSNTYSRRRLEDYCKPNPLKKLVLQERGYSPIVVTLSFKLRDLFQSLPAPRLFSPLNGIILIDNKHFRERKRLKIFTKIRGGRMRHEPIDKQGNPYKHFNFLKRLESDYLRDEIFEPILTNWKFKIPGILGYYFIKQPIIKLYDFWTDIREALLVRKMTYLMQWVQKDPFVEELKKRKGSFFAKNPILFNDSIYYDSAQERRAIYADITQRKLLAFEVLDPEVIREYKDFMLAFFVDYFSLYRRFLFELEYTFFSAKQTKVSPNQNLDLHYKKLYYLEHINNLRDYNFNYLNERESDFILKINLFKGVT
ncbi:hypothetical protein ACFOQM_10785, partial [Paenibacillus sp. GCM10012307]